MRSRHGATLAIQKQTNNFLLRDTEDIKKTKSLGKRGPENCLRNTEQKNRPKGGQPMGGQPLKN